MIDAEREKIYDDFEYQRHDYDYTVIPSDSYEQEKNYMKWENISECMINKFNFMYAFIAFNYRIKRSSGVDITTADDISMRQNLWTHFKTHEINLGTPQRKAIEQQDYANVSEQVMSLLRFSPHDVDKKNSLIYYSPDQYNQYFTSRFCDKNEGIYIGGELADTGFTRDTRYTWDVPAPALGSKIGLPDFNTISANHFAGWKIIIASNTRNGDASGAFPQYKGHVLTIVSHVNAGIAPGIVIRFTVKEDYMPWNTGIGNAGTLRSFRGYITPSVDFIGSPLIADELIRTYDTTNRMTRRLYLPLRLLASSSFLMIDQILKNLQTKLRFDLQDPEQLFVRPNTNTTDYRAYIINADLHLPTINIEQDTTFKNTFYNIGSSRTLKFFRCKTIYDQLTAGQNNIIQLGDFSTSDDSLEYAVIALKDNNNTWDYRPMTFNDCGLSHIEVRIGGLIKPYFKPDYGKDTLFDDLYIDFCQAREKFYRCAGLPLDILDKFPSLDLKTWRNTYPLIVIPFQRYYREAVTEPQLNVSVKLTLSSACAAYTTIIRQKRYTFEFGVGDAKTTVSN